MEYLKIGWLLVLAIFIGAVRSDTDTDDAAQTETEPPTITTTTTTTTTTRRTVAVDDENESHKIPNHYNFAFETENGQVRDENIDLNRDKDSVAPKMDLNFKGSYSFISADGYEYITHYKADKKGFRPYVTAHKIKTD